MSITSYISHARRIQQERSGNRSLQTHLLWVLLLRTILYTLLLVVSYFLEESRDQVVAVPQGLLVVLVIAVYATSIFSALSLLIFQGNPRTFGVIQILLDTLFVSLLVFFTGTSLSHFTIVYFFPIITAGLLLPLKGGLVAAAAASLQLGLLLFLERQYIILPYLREYISQHPPSLVNSLNLFTTHGLLFFLTGLLSIFFGQRLRRTETALSDSLQKFDALSLLYKKIFDNISTGILTIDEQQRISSANNALTKIIGIGLHDLLGRQLRDIFPGIRIKTENLRYTMDFRKTHGETLRIGYSYMLMAPEGKKRTAEMILTMRNITELENLERQVRQAEKLAAIGTMSASIAHDFRNPLTAISGSAQVLAADFTTATDQNRAHLELAEIILRESNRLIETIGDFLKFARPESLQLDWILLKDCLKEVLHMLSAGGSLPPTVQVRTDFPGELAVWVDEKQLFTLLTHLIQNAIPFCPAGDEEITIQAREKNGVAVTGQQSASQLEITVSDNGSGIDTNSAELIFEPFHTSRADGTGLGLAIVRQIVNDHHGTIDVANSGLPNPYGSHGARFVVRLPLPAE